MAHNTRPHQYYQRASKQHTPSAASSSSSSSSSHTRARCHRHRQSSSLIRSFIDNFSSVAIFLALTVLLTVNSSLAALSSHASSSNSRITSLFNSSNSFHTNSENNSSRILQKFFTVHPSVTLVPTITLVKDEEVSGSSYLRLTLDAHTECPKERQLLLLLMQWRLEPLEQPLLGRSFVGSNLTVSWHANASNDNGHGQAPSLVEHRQLYRTSLTETATQFFDRLLRTTFSTRSSTRQADNRDIQDEETTCQFWRIINDVAHISEQTTPSTISVCTDGTVNGIFYLPDHSRLIVEQESLNQKCSNWQQKKEENFSEYSALAGCSSHRAQWHPPIPQTNFQGQNTIKRNKRSMSFERNIEILVVADQSMVDYHGRSLKPYVLTLMASVANIYEHSSIGNEINIRVVRFHQGEDESVWPDAKNPKESSTAQTALRRFCKWQRDNNYADDSHELHHDTAILLTRRDLCRNATGQSSIFPAHNGRTLCDTLGLAHSGQICDPDSSCAIVEDNGLAAAFTIAHELGHVLGIPHDEEEKCRSYYRTKEGAAERTQWETIKKGFKESNVMARMIDFNSHMWSWSPCSRHFITEFLDSGNGECLLDTERTNLLQSPNSGHSGHQRRRSSSKGQFHDPDTQCALVFGANSTLCHDMPTCRRLWCKTPESLGCKTQHMPWAEGTECAIGRWCQEGECIPRSPSTSIDGGWGEWSAFSECSLTCGGGVRRSKRVCNNPSPQNGGKHCLGKRIQYESCNIQPCAHKVDIRAQQCSEFNGQKFNIPGVHKDVTWVPEYNGILESERCRLYCADSVSGKSYMLRERVTDGTPCSPNGFDVCVNGNCLSAGCDRKLGSDRRLDRCGVCGGDNSTCREIRGKFKPASVVHGYNPVLQIPAGASNIEVKKDHSAAGTSDNWLAIRTDSGEYLLNGRFVVNMYRRKWEHAGATLEYSGVRTQAYEMINSTRTIKRPLFIELLSVGELTTPEIEYRYSVAIVHDKNRKSPTKNSENSENSNKNSSSGPHRSTTEAVNFVYRWTQSRWSQCNRACDGEQSRHWICVLVRTNGNGRRRTQRLPDEYCVHIAPKPAPVMRACNMDCEFKWLFHSHENCTSKCGPGSRKVNFGCYKVASAKNHWIHDNECQKLVKIHKLPAKPDHQEACEGTECRPIYQWITHAWRSCVLSNATCGAGQEVRDIECQQSTQHDNGNIVSKIVENNYCRDSIPESSRTCVIECPHWRQGEWSECLPTESQQKCGIGEQRRSVECVHHNVVVDGEYCSITGQSQPESRKHCEIPCPTTTVSYAVSSSTEYSHMSFEWVTTNWTSCKFLHGHLQSIENQFLRIFPHLPPCFNSSEAKTLFQQRYALLIQLNETFNEKSIDKLRGIFSISESMLMKKRHTYCIDSVTHTDYSDDHCSQISRPITREYCPVFDEYKPFLRDYQYRDCDCSNPADRESVQCSNSSSSTHSTTTELPENSRIEATTSLDSSLSFVFTETNTAPPKGALTQQESTSTLANTIYDFLPESSSQQNNSIQIARWFYSEWSNCTAQCNSSTVSEQLTNNGRRTRTVECLDGNRTTVNSSYCDGQPGPTEQSCRSEEVASLCSTQSFTAVWRTENWSECSELCGNGSQSRLVTCHRINSHGFIDSRNLIDEQHCLKTGEEKPRSSQECSLGPCPESHDSTSNVWRPLPWQPCSKSCGDGYQKRKLMCVDYRTGFRVDQTLCNFQKKPEQTRSCNSRQCSIMSCADIRQRSFNADDGEYEIWIQGIKVKVYCRGMRTDSQPREYLKLLASEENFSQIFYPKNCEQSNEMRSRTYHFNYILLNLTTLQIKVSDTTFAYTIHRNEKKMHQHPKGPVGYGQASIHGCGRRVKNNEISTQLSTTSHYECQFDNSVESKFSINLQNTGLVIAPHQRWNHAPYMVQNMNNTKLTGVCRASMNSTVTHTLNSRNKCQYSCLPMANTPTEESIQLIVL